MRDSGESNTALGIEESVIALCFSLACGLIDVPWRRSKGAPGDGVTALATAVKAVMEKYGVSSLATADSTVIQPQRRLGNPFMALQWVQLTAARAAAPICLPPPYRVALELQLEKSPVLLDKPQVRLAALRW